MASASKRILRSSLSGPAIQLGVNGQSVIPNLDFAGDTVDIFDPITGEVRAMKLFVAALGASNYTYAEACPSESLSDWIGVHASLFSISAACRSSWSAIISRPP
jgi:hypothetical protein